MRVLIDTDKFLQVFNVTLQTFLNEFDFKNNEFVEPANGNNNNNNNSISSRAYGQCIYDDINDTIYYFGGINTINNGNQFNEVLDLDLIIGYHIKLKHWWILENKLSRLSRSRIKFEAIKNDRKVWIIGGISLISNEMVKEMEIFNFGYPVSNSC